MAVNQFNYTYGSKSLKLKKTKYIFTFCCEALSPSFGIILAFPDMAVETAEYQPVETTDVEDQEFKEQSDDNASSTTLLSEKDQTLSKFRYLRRDAARVPYLWIFAINFSVLAVATIFFISAHIARINSVANLEYARQQNRHFDAHCTEKVSTYCLLFWIELMVQS